MARVGQRIFLLLVGLVDWRRLRHFEVSLPSLPQGPILLFILLPSSITHPPSLTTHSTPTPSLCSTISNTSPFLRSIVFSPTPLCLNYHLSHYCCCLAVIVLIILVLLFVKHCFIRFIQIIRLSAFPLDSTPLLPISAIL